MPDTPERGRPAGGSLGVLSRSPVVHSSTVTRDAQTSETHMKIGIIGAGHIGSALTRRLTALGHTVLVANSRNPETLSDLAAETGATAVTPQEAVKDVDLIVLTIPEKNVPHLPHDLFADVPPALPVVDTGNYYPQQRDGRIAAIEDGLPESRWVEQTIGHPVIKVFNNIYSVHLQENGKPQGAHGRIALPVAGDDPAAKAIVLDLVNDLGFDPVDVGGLDESWRQQPGTPVYAADLDMAGVKKALSEARPERAAQWKAT
ncbi:MAG: NAD(P)-binding domain-containing protein [Gluconacetobacter sp.]